MITSTGRKSRNPKAEIRNRSEARILKSRGHRPLRVSLFLRNSTFGFRILARVLLGAFRQRKNYLFIGHLFFEQRDLVSTTRERQRNLPALGHGTIHGRGRANSVAAHE